MVRADSGFFAQELLQYLESRQLHYIVVARMTSWLKREPARVQAWRALDTSYAVGEFRLQLFGWDQGYCGRVIGIAGMAASSSFVLVAALVPVKCTAIILPSLAYASLNFTLPSAWSLCVNFGE